jgi:sialidase-1
MFLGLRLVSLCAIAVGLVSSSSKPATALPQMESTLLWEGNTGAYETYRIPGIVVTVRGVVLAYGVGRRFIKDGDWSDSDILLRRSIDGGQAWESSRRIAGSYARIFYMRSRNDGVKFTKPVQTVRGGPSLVCSTKEARVIVTSQ